MATSMPSTTKPMPSPISSAVVRSRSIDTMPGCRRTAIRTALQNCKSTSTPFTRGTFSGSACVIRTPKVLRRSGSTFGMLKTLATSLRRIWSVGSKSMRQTSSGIVMATEYCTISSLTTPESSPDLNLIEESSSCDKTLLVLTCIMRSPK